MGYSTDLKTCAVAYYRNNETTLRAVEAIFGVSRSSLSRWINETSKPVRQKRTKRLDSSCDVIAQLLLEKPSITLKSIRYKLSEQKGVHASTSTIWRHLKEQHYSYKKMRRKTVCPKNTSEIKDRCREEVCRIGLDKVYCIDEVGFSLELVPSRGWSSRGERCYYKSKRGGHQKYSAIFLISERGIAGWRVYRENINGESFVHFLEVHQTELYEKCLVMDLRVHHMRHVKEYLKNNRTQAMYIPPYSPDLNPIEEVFGYLKTELRQRYIATEGELLESLRGLVIQINRAGLERYYNRAYKQ